MVLKTNALRTLAGLMVIFALAACAGQGSSDSGGVVETPVPVSTPDPTPPAVPRDTVETRGLDSADSRFGPATYSSFRDYVEADRVFFDFDESNIRQDARPVLERMAEWLNHHGDVRFTIEGHCDRRGTREYNLALGDRRATSIRQFLTAQGISPSRINTISYGKERLDAAGSTERAHQRNRRALVTFN